MQNCTTLSLNLRNPLKRAHQAIPANAGVAFLFWQRTLLYWAKLHVSIDPHSSRRDLTIICPQCGF